MAKKKHGNKTTTITLSMPHETKEFLDQLAVAGYNRSNLVLKLVGVIEELYKNYPTIPLPLGVEHVVTMVKEGRLLPEFKEGRLIAKPKSKGR